jgi:hypothetical protein
MTDGIEERSDDTRQLSGPLFDTWDPEFSNALLLAIEIGVTKPLRDYVAAGKPLPQDLVSVRGRPVENVRALVAELLGDHSPEQRPRRGRPRRIPHRAKDAEEADSGLVLNFTSSGMPTLRRRSRSSAQSCGR